MKQAWDFSPASCLSSLPAHSAVAILSRLWLDNVGEMIYFKIEIMEKLNYYAQSIEYISY